MAIRILAVDDEPQLERLIKQRLRKEFRQGSYELTFAENGHDALAALQESGGFDVVLTDINMPEMDGLTLLKAIKSNWPNQQVVMVSAYGDMGNIRSAMNLGAFDFVTKPIDFEDLKITIEKTAKGASLIKKGEQAEELATENKRLIGIDQLKNDFFTNISHEFRTPLTVINGMLQQLELDPHRWLASGLPLIKSNTHQLLDLVNQVLELRKIASGTLPVHWIQADIIEYLLYLSESYIFLAEAKDVHLSIESRQKTLIMDFDPDKLLRIFSNLLSNAIKFTETGGHIRFSIEVGRDQLSISVSDTGRGIPKDKLDHIFDPFSQSFEDDYQQGTGIGLAIVKQMTELLKGQIEVESQLGNGTVFKVSLPIHHRAKLEENTLPREHRANYSVEQTLPGGSSSNGLPRVLITEDNPDIRAFLHTLLADRYDCMLAEDGEQGWEMLLEEIPDLIISDLMMPRLGGLELCQRLKEDKRVSHIPIILLTAKADLDTRLEGLRYGADAYLVKPFHREELLLQIEQLLDLRNQLQEHYKNVALGLEPSNQATEDEFVLTIRNLVEANIDDEGFGIQEICRAAAVSRTQMHRKLKALTGLSTSHFIRSIRLEQAKKLLKTSDLNIAQVAYEVGFRDPKYFSKIFSEAFGESPANWRK